MATEPNLVNCQTEPPASGRWLYAARLNSFLSESESSILGTLVAGSQFSVEINQRNAWVEQIRLLKDALAESSAPGSIYFEFVIPRLGKRIDVVLAVEHVLYVIEFKVGETTFTTTALDQVWDYALDLKYFHESSHAVCMAPLLVATSASAVQITASGTVHDDRLLRPIRVGSGQLRPALDAAKLVLSGEAIDPARWERGRYLPTPTIIEAARALYAGHSVDEISRSDAGAINLSKTSCAVDKIIEEAKDGGRKSVVFVTGVPGAGKTLVGLDVANRHMDPKSALYSVFLSGNAPLVAVLREALARDLVQRDAERGTRTRKGDAIHRVSSFIQNVHHFRDECLADDQPPPEHVALFDEAQRAWNLEQTRSFMQRKKGVDGFNQSEPEFLISCLDRHLDWAVVVCLIGGGQEINTGEGGISEWINALTLKFPDWHLYMAPQLKEAEYGATAVLSELSSRRGVHFDRDLHLATSMRSFRAETLSDFVRLVLELDVAGAKAAYDLVCERYPVVLTRSVVAAKQWLRDQARGSERYGMVVSSQAHRLKPHAIDVRTPINPVHWFLHGKEDIRSSYYLEDVATEFQVQGLELDWSCVVWDGDLRFNNDAWRHHEFVGTKWRNINAPERRSMA